ncbi:MAG: hypothetical protein IT337_06855 [Thermomicrobiales bacterium]|nr:hypothetical protein [Thermomicrobiales bacterium]
MPESNLPEEPPAPPIAAPARLAWSAFIVCVAVTLLLCVWLALVAWAR